MRRLRPCDAVALILACPLMMLARPAPAQVGAWFIHETPMPIPNSEFSTVLLDGRVYAVGGFLEAAQHLLQIYDPVADTWQQGAEIPEHTHHSGVVAFDGKVYSIAGSGGRTDWVQIYDPVTDSWSRGAEMPTPRTALAVTVFDGKIHAIAGSRSIGRGTALPAHEVYDPVLDAWEPRAPIPTPVEHVFAVTVGDLIYVVAGRTDLVPTNLLQIYDPATDTWSAGPPLIAVTSGHAVEVCDGQIYVFGGEDIPTSAVTAAFQRFDPATGVWTMLDPGPVPVHGVASARIGGTLYFFGGSEIAASGVGTDIIQQYVCSEGDGEAGTEEEPPPPSQ